MPSKVFCFGELLLRMSPSLGGRWLEDAALPVYVGGAEANVATALANWDVPVAYCSAMPEHYLSQEISTYLLERGVDISVMHWGGQRIGVYYLAQGTDLKHAGVIYDRAHSSFAGLKPGMIDWDRVLEGIGWFHFSAISPALNPQVVAVCREALEAATRKHITISIDLNHRAKLWQYGQAPETVMPELVEYCDVVMGNIWAAQSLLGIPVDTGMLDEGSKAQYVAHAAHTVRVMQERFPRCRTVANTFRFDAGTGIHYYATLHSGGATYISEEFKVPAVVDKVGSGDCFMAGLIYGLGHAHAPQAVINFAAAAAVGKLQERGDATGQTIADIQKLMEHHA